MKIAIMQPYIFPYIGYFQLINAADIFVIYDDVNYIKQGWINRNYILANGKRQLITLELKGASSFKLINEITLGGNRKKMIKTIFQAYTKAPYFSEVFPLIEKILDFKNENLAAYITNSLENIIDFLDIRTDFVVSSRIEKSKDLKAQARVLDICRSLKGDAYINLTRGAALYSKDEFNKHSIKLYIIKKKDIAYKQFRNEYIHDLSIIDVLMFNPKDEIKKMLNAYELTE